MTDAIPAISLRGLSKSYGTLAAVRGVSLDVMPGEVFGFLGLNGAGKTTTIRILLDLLRPSEGSAALFGIDCQRESRKTRALAGYLPGELGLYADMTGEELLDLMARLGPHPAEQLVRVELMDRLELSHADLRRRIREYSTGMKRKLGLIQALQSDPPLVILDEPTEGLDPLVQRALHEILFELRSRGRTVFMSSHVLSEVERVCDRIAVIRKGEIVLLSTVDEARRRSGRTVRVHFARPVDGPTGESDLRRAHSPVGPAITLPAGMTLTGRKPDQWIVRVPGDVGELIPLLATLPVRDIEIIEPALEDVLSSFYREESA